MMTVSRESQTSGRARSTILRADLMLLAFSFSTRSFMTKGLNSSRAISFGQAALIHLQLGADDDNGTAGVVNTLAQQVLAEAALPFSISDGTSSARLLRAGDQAAAAAIVDQGVNALLHTLLVADDDVGRTELQQTLQAVVAG